MKRTIACMLGILLISAAAVADEPGFVWSRTTLKLVESGDPAKGEALAAEHKCARCHGDTGISDEDDTPSLAGQLRSYQFKQLMDWKTTMRDEHTMIKRLCKQPPELMADVAAFYEAHKRETPPEREASALATRGDESRLLIACDTCHGSKGAGYGMESPVLTGQKVEYFIETMTAFKEGDRESDHFGRM